MKSNHLILLVALLFSISFVNCSDNEATTSRVQFILVDAPGDYKEVNIDIIDILANTEEDEEGWTSLEGVNADIYDLIELTGGTEALLATVELPVGYLNQIRLKLGTENTVVVEDDDGNDVEFELSTPSAQQSGLKLNLHTELIAGVTHTFILDWDADKSVITAGNSGNYILKPVIRVTAEATSGAIHGRVADIDETAENAEPMPLEGAMISVFDETDTLVSTTYSNSQGIFVVHGLEVGSYTLIVENTGYNASDLIGPIDVTIGAATDVGTILIAKTS